MDNDKDRTDKRTEADRADLRMFVWMSVITFVLAILVWPSRLSAPMRKPTILGMITQARSAAKLLSKEETKDRSQYRQIAGACVIDGYCFPDSSTLPVLELTR